MSQLTIDQLRAVMPHLSEKKANDYLPYLIIAMEEANITTPERQAAFLAQLAHESVELRYFEEIASGAAYENRHDLGNIHPGDGVRYKGRGPIQLTGRTNYRAAGEALGLPLEDHPEQAADLDTGFRTAGWFWSIHDLNDLADQATMESFHAITKKINGGHNGQESRDGYYKTAIAILVKKVG